MPEQPRLYFDQMVTGVALFSSLVFLFLLSVPACVALAIKFILPNPM